MTPARAEPAPGESTQRIELLHTHDSDGALSRERRLIAERDDADARHWRGQLADLDERRGGTRGRGQSLGLELQLPEDSPATPGPLRWLRSLSATAYSAAPAYQWGVVAGSGPVSVGLSREMLAWWVGLSARQQRLRAEPQFASVQWAFDCARLRVSDGNRIDDCLLRAEPRWAASADERWQLFALAHRRSARQHSAYYWSPEQAESHAGLGLRTRWRRGAWQAEAMAQELRPLNEASAPTRRFEAALQWQPSAAWQVGLAVEQDRNREGNSPYRSKGARAFIEYRGLALGGGPGR